jgi:hypothetical protein
MKKVIIGLVLLGAIVALRPAARRMHEMREHCGQMAAQCKQMAAQYAGRGEADNA